MRILIKSGGDLATGVALALFRAGYEVIICEIEKPTTVRRMASFSTAVFTGSSTVEGVTATLAHSPTQVQPILHAGNIPVLIDPLAQSIDILKPDVLVDAIVAKKNLSTSITDAPLVIALGPGFTAQVDCHAVIETQRGKTLGEIIYTGSAIPNTGVPGQLGGETIRRVLRAPSDGIFRAEKQIAAEVSAGDVLAHVDYTPIIAEISGVLRGILMDGLIVKKGDKCGDIDPRGDASLCYQASDKANKIGLGVLEAIKTLYCDKRK